jgi:serine/threonine-protein kinase
MESVLEQLRTALKDRYRVDDEIGRGGMATVFRAQDLRYDRPVAIKVLSPDISSVVSAERFTREIRISAKLSHPNILTVFDSGEIGELLYYVMTYVEGESLRARMKRETYLPMEDAIRITCEVADALSYAHEQGVIHRDIKPENILLRAGHVLVADFGIARLSETEGESLTAVGMSVGTAAYMSPEQSAGDTVTPRADIYSLGTTLYEMLAGQLPFTGPNAMAIAARRMMEPVPPIRIVRPAVPEQLEAVVMCSMERVAADRFQTMDDFKRAILGEAGTMSMTASRYTPLYMTSTRMTPAENNKRRMMMWGGIGALVIAIAVGGFLFFRKGAPPPAAAGADAKRVAVLYFDDASNGSLRYLADGLTESLIDRLSTISALDVISKDGVRPFRGADVSGDSVAKVLQVGSIVRGSLEPEGGKVGLEIRLVDAAANVDIARKRFDVDTAHIVASQAELATNVADFLREHLGAEIRLRDERAATTSSQAWTLVERAGKLRKDADSLAATGGTDAALTAIARADSLLAAAQRLDGQWAKIPVLRANAMYAKASQLTRQPSQMAAAIDDGLSHAEQALRLQPNNPDALEVKGQLLYLRYARRVDTDPSKIERLLPEAESNLQRAVELNKDQAGAWAALSSLYYSKPDIQAANTAALNAYRADAYLSSAKLILKRLFWTSHDLEQFPEALKYCTEGRRRYPTDPDFTSCRLWMYTTRYEKPDLDSAWAYRARYIALTPEKSRPYAQKMGDILVAGAIARAGLPDSARHVLLRARATPEEDPSRDLEGTEAVIRVILGDQDEAVRLIADYLTVNPGHRKGFATRTGWWWRDIQGNPKFKALIAGAR